MTDTKEIELRMLHFAAKNVGAGVNFSIGIILFIFILIGYFVIRFG